MTSRPQRTASMERLWTGATTACVPRAPARPAEGTGGLMASVARELSAPAASVEDARPSTADAGMLSLPAKPPTALPRPAAPPPPPQAAPEAVHKRTLIAVHGIGVPSQCQDLLFPLNGNLLTLSNLS